MVQGIMTDEYTLQKSLQEPTIQEYAQLFFSRNPTMPTVVASTLHMRLLGEFQLLLHGMPASRLDMPRLQSLVAYLVLHRGVAQARSRLAYLLWPDSTDAQAHTNLRNLLFKLRTILPEIEGCLRIERQTLCWREEAFCSLDIQDFEQAIAHAEQAAHLQDIAMEQQALEMAVQTYQGDLLPNCYDDWIQEERERLQLMYVGALERLMELLEQQGNYQGAIRVAQRLLRHDPLQEVTYRRLMRLYAARGDRGAVVRTYQSCVAILRRELAIEPGLTTRRAYERFMESEV